MIDRLAVRMFAGARERVGSDFIEVEVLLPISVLHLKKAIHSQFDSLGSLVEFGRIAIDQEFVSDSMMLDESSALSAIALIPPVSGG